MHGEGDQAHEAHASPCHSNDVPRSAGPLPAALAGNATEPPNVSLSAARPGPGTEAVAARLPRIPLGSDTRSATSVTPRRWCSAEGFSPGRSRAAPAEVVSY